MFELKKYVLDNIYCCFLTVWFVTTRLCSNRCSNYSYHIAVY